MLPLDPQGLEEVTTGPVPHGGRGHAYSAQRQSTLLRTPVRIGTAAIALAACVGASAGGVALGSVLQGHLEARPDATEVRKLDALNAPERPTGKVDPQAGPNRADLGGGR